MADLRFGWDAAKAARNEEDHGVSFETATLAFDDPFALEWLDNREDYGEDRFVILGMVDSRLPAALRRLHDAGRRLPDHLGTRSRTP